MSGIPWTDKEVGILKKLAENNFLISDIIKVLPSRSRNSISQKAYSLGFSLHVAKAEINMCEFKKLIKGR